MSSELLLSLQRSVQKSKPLGEKPIIQVTSLKKLAPPPLTIEIPSDYTNSSLLLTQPLKSPPRSPVLTQKELYQALSTSKKRAQQVYHLNRGLSYKKLARKVTEANISPSARLANPTLLKPTPGLSSTNLSHRAPLNLLSPSSKNPSKPSHPAYPSKLANLCHPSPISQSLSSRKLNILSRIAQKEQFPTNSSNNNSKSKIF